MNPRSEWFRLILIENSVWINPSSDWNLGFGLIRIVASDQIELGRIDFFTDFHQTRYKTFFGLVCNNSHWRNRVKFIEIRRFRLKIYFGLSLDIFNWNVRIQDNWKLSSDWVQIHRIGRSDFVISSISILVLF